MFIGNLNFETTKEELESVLAVFGDLVDLHLPKDRETGRPRGIAFAEFETLEQAETAIRELNGKELGGRQLRTDSAAERSPRRGGGGGGGGGPRRSFDPGPPPERYGAVENARPRNNKGSRRGLRGKKRSLN